jgi:hypothetical protein
MDDITRRGNQVRFALDETFLRADTLARLEAIEKMLNLGLIRFRAGAKYGRTKPNRTNREAHKCY